MGRMGSRDSACMKAPASGGKTRSGVETWPGGGLAWCMISGDQLSWAGEQACDGLLHAAHVLGTAATHRCVRRSVLAFNNIAASDAVGPLATCHMHRSAHSKQHR